jgi:hypothetical protein
MGVPFSCRQADEGGMLKIFREKRDAWFGLITAVSELALPYMVLRQSCIKSPGRIHIVLAGMVMLKPDK